MDSGDEAHLRDVQALVKGIGGECVGDPTREMFWTSQLMSSDGDLLCSFLSKSLGWVRRVCLYGVWWLVQGM